MKATPRSRWSKLRHLNIQGHLRTQPLGTLSEDTGKTQPGTLTMTTLNRITNAPIAGATVTVTNSDTDELAATGITGSDGVFTTDQIPGDYYYVWVSHPDYDDNFELVQVDGDIPVTISLKQHIPKPGTVTVSVHSIVPIGDASVTVSVSDTGEQIATGTTDSHGIFITTQLPEGSYNVRVSHLNYYDAGYDPVLVRGDVTASVYMEPRVPGAVTITALDDATDAPISGARVVVSDRRTHAQVATGITDRNGILTTAQLPGGDYYVEVSHDGYFSGSTYVLVSGNTTDILTLELRIAGTLTIMVTDQATNEPIDGAEILIRDSDSWDEVTSRTTGTDGSFTTDALPGGGYYVEVSHDGYFSNGIWVRLSGDTTEKLILWHTDSDTDTSTDSDTDTDTDTDNPSVSVGLDEFIQRLVQLLILILIQILGSAVGR